MIRYNLKTYGTVILGLAFATFVILFIATQDLKSIDSIKVLENISTTISINIILWAFFVSCAWKWKFFHSWLVQTPNLSGVWKGEIKTNWEDAKEEIIKIEIKIKQSFFHIQVKINTEESSSYSLSASFDIDKERGHQRLFYTYLNTPKSGVRNRSAIHYGSALLNFDGFNVEEMEGEYWTSRESSGEIKLKKQL